MTRIYRVSILALVAGLIAFTATSYGQTDVYRLQDSPFSWYQCYRVGDFLEGPADYFGEDVCVDYQALNSVTTRIKQNKDGSQDVGWSLIQKGTATIYQWLDGAGWWGCSTTNCADPVLGDVLYTGPFQVEEIGQDDDNDAGCVGGSPDEPVAWFGKCSINPYGNLEFMNYQWKITGSKVYFFKVIIKNGGYCWMDSREILYDGGACPAGLAK